MKLAAWVGVAYLAVVGGAEMYSNMATGTTGTADTIATLPSIGSLMHSTGTTAAMLDLGGAAAIWFFVLR